jgi:hypothetical protein
VSDRNINAVVEKRGGRSECRVIFRLACEVGHCLDQNVSASSARVENSFNDRNTFRFSSSRRLWDQVVQEFGTEFCRALEERIFSDEDFASSQLGSQNA